MNYERHPSSFGGRSAAAGNKEWLDAALAQISRERLCELAMAIVAIPSPTGEERRLAEFLAETLKKIGLDAAYQPIDENQGNAIARYRGAGGGADLMLYAPIDTHISGTEEEDLPWIGRTLRPDLQPEPHFEDGLIVGLCAENPKGHAACVIAAAEAIKRAGVPLMGDLMVGLGAGGMPTNKRPSINRYNAGQGNGCSFMIEQGFRSDFAIITKPGWSVAYEEVGLSWHRIRVHGYFGYAGSRHRVKHKNPILDAAKVIEGLEAWFPEYTARNTSGLVAPQGSIGAIQGGYPHKPSFISAACDIYLDLRLSPRTDPQDARQQLLAALAGIRRKHPELDITHEMILAVPGTTTPPENWIIQSGIRAWEAVEGAPHEAKPGTSGATDAAILRGRGIPTARIGMPPVAKPNPYTANFSMGVVDPDQMMRLTQTLIRIALDTCTRPRSEVGLA
jgi:acetylornithine deacetylase/succinyl-diaminopimelate desuccinylase-like protein